MLTGEGSRSLKFVYINHQSQYLTFNFVMYMFVLDKTSKIPVRWPG